jgi:hypothetical protein
VWVQHRRKHNGSKLMNHLMAKNKQVVLWADEKSVGFFKALNFKENEHIRKESELDIDVEPDCVFLCWGFEDYEEEYSNSEFEKWFG